MMGLEEEDVLSVACWVIDDGAMASTTFRNAYILLFWLFYFHFRFASKEETSYPAWGASMYNTFWVTFDVLAPAVLSNVALH